MWYDIERVKAGEISVSWFPLANKDKKDEKKYVKRLQRTDSGRRPCISGDRTRIACRSCDRFQESDHK